MKIVTVSWVRNEGDVLEAFVRHHAAFVSRMVIVDHRSQDNSRDILRALKEEGLPIDIRFNDDLPHRQADTLTQLANEYARKDNPDWLIPLDGDEFLVSQQGRNIPEALAEEDGNRVLHLPWRCYVPMPNDAAGEPHVLRRITHRRTKEHPQWWKVALPRTVLRAQGGCRICPGSHLALDHLGTPLDAAASKHLALAHFPVRSVEQITRKIAGGWLSDSLDRARRGDSPSGASFQWKAILDELTSGKQLTSDDLTRIALSYATVEQWNSLPQSFTQGTIDRFVLHQNDAATAPVAAGPVMRDPIETTSLLRYPHRPVTALAVLLKSTEDLTEEYIRLTTQRTADR